MRHEGLRRVVEEPLAGEQRLATLARLLRREARRQRLGGVRAACVTSVRKIPRLTVRQLYNKYYHIILHRRPHRAPSAGPRRQEA